MKTSHHALNLTRLLGVDYLGFEFQRNVTEKGGEISIELKSTGNSTQNVRRAQATVTLYTASSPSTGWDIDVVGVHLVKRGTVVMTTISDKFNGGFALPHFMLNEEDYNQSKPMMDIMMTEAVQKTRDQPQTMGGNGFFAIPNCEYIIWLQQRPMMVDAWQNMSSTAIRQLEAELELPDGAPVIEPPVIDFSAVLFSPDCGIVLESELSGPKAEVFWSSARRLMIALIIVVGMEIILLKRQMDEAATPSTRSRISYQTIAIMAMGDGLMFSAFVYLLIADSHLWLLVAAVAFVKCLNVAFLEVKFLYDLWTVQVGDPAERESERTRNTPPEGLPLPATAPRPTGTGATPIILPSDQGDFTTASATSFATVYSRFYFIMIVLMFVSMWAMTWPAMLRTAYANTLAFLYLSFWVPQIYRNILRNCRKAMSWDYMIGISILRTVTIVYWYFDHHNLLAFDASSTTGYVMMIWVWLQVVVLGVQYFLGPRLFIPAEWCPPAYEYHPLLQQGDEEAGLPIGEVASASEGKDKDDKQQNRKIFDCAICMNEIDVPVVSKTEKGSAWLEQRNYMVTPCRHIFHTECLEGWMNLRLVCPICRETLPSL